MRLEDPFESYTRVRRRTLRRSAGWWAVTALAFLIVIIRLIVPALSSLQPGFRPTAPFASFLATLAGFTCLLIGLVQLMRSLFAHASEADVRLEQDLAGTPRLVIRPSAFGYGNKWVRNLALPAVTVFVLVTIFRLKSVPGTSGALLLALGGFALIATIFFSRAEIVVDQKELSYRRLIRRRRFSLDRVGGLAMRRLGLAFNSYARRPPPYAVVYGSDGRALFSFSAALWSDADLERLQAMIGGDSRDWPMSARDLQDEFPGALSWWVIFMDSHPVWTLVIGTPLMFVAIVLALALWYLFK